MTLKSMRTGFLAWNAFQVAHVAEIMRHFEEPDVIFTDFLDKALFGFDPQWLTKYGAYSRFVRETELDRLDGEYDAIVAVMPRVLPLRKPWAKTRLVICQYSMAKPKTVYNDRWRTADLGLVYGDHSDRIIGAMCPTAQIGNPRFDPFFEKRLDPFVLQQFRKALDPNKKTIAFLPTWGDLGSHALFEQALESLLSDYNVIFKHHHMTTVHESTFAQAWGRGAIDAGSITSVLDAGPFMMELADVVVSDMSGAIFDALYCQKPTIILSPAADLSDHRMTSPSALEIARRSEIGPAVTESSQLRPAIRQMLETSNPYRAANELLVKEIFAQRGNCGALAAKSIYALMDQAAAAKTSATPNARAALHEAHHKIAIGRDRHQRGHFVQRGMRAIGIAMRSFTAKKDRRQVPKVARLLSSGDFFGAGIEVERWASLEAKDARHYLYAFYEAASNLRFSRRLFRRQLACLHAYAENEKAPVANRRTVLRDLGHLAEARTLGAELSDAIQLNLENAAAALGSLDEYLERAVQNESVTADRQTAQSPRDGWISLKDASGKIFEIAINLGFARAVSRNVADNRLAMLAATRAAIDTLRQEGWTILPRLQAGYQGAVPITGRYPSLTWHTTDTAVPGQLHFKVGSLGGYIIIDSRGYSGWSSLAQMALPEITHGVNEDHAAQQVEFLRETIIAQQRSKYRQAIKKVSVMGAYIFFPMQILDDTVSRLSYISGLDLLEYLAKWGKMSGRTIVVKRHPKCKDPRIAAALLHHRSAKRIVVSNASIHDLIAGAECVVTVNSGVGAEALLHLKPVITTGRSDYAAATFVAKTPEELFSALNQIPFDPIPPDELKKFVWYYTKRFQVRGEDAEAVNARLKELTADL